jgi:type IV secretion system protein TrbI
MDSQYDTSPLLGALPHDPQRLSRTMVYGVLTALALIVIVGLFLGVRRMTAPPTPAIVQPNDTPALTAPTPPLEPYIKVPTTFANLDRRPPAPPEPTQPPPLPPVEPLLPPWTPPVAAARPADVPQTPPKTEAKVPAVKKKEEKQRRSVFSQQFAFGKPPLQEQPQSPAAAGPAPRPEAFKSQDEYVDALTDWKTQHAVQQTIAQRDAKDGSVIREAVWEKPSDGSKIWYRSQALVGQLAEAVVSSIGGQVVIRVTRDLEDKRLRGVVLVPQHSLIVAKQAAKPDFGHDRLALGVEQIELPDDSILVPKAQAYDQFGGAGVGGKVQNHYGRILFGATLSALLSVGTRIPTGNTTGFVPTIGQDVTQSISQDIAQTGRQVIQRELDRSPTITLPAGTPVRIHPNENISFTRGPKIIR